MCEQALRVELREWVGDATALGVHTCVGDLVLTNRGRVRLNADVSEANIVNGLIANELRTRRRNLRDALNDQNADISGFLR